MEGSQAPQPQQQPYQPGYYPQQPYQAAPAQAPPPLPTMYLWLCLVGVILLVVGLILGASSAFADDQDTAGNMIAFGSILGSIGTLLLAIGLLAPAFMTREMDILVRVALLLSTALIIGLYFG